MISSVFGKTKPINYILVLSFLSVLFVLAHLRYTPQPMGPQDILEALLPLAALLLSVFMLNFIVQKNQLTAAHSYAILLFALFMLLFPRTVLESKGVYAYFFVLLGMRRLISMRSLRSTRTKALDATLWFAAASFFVPWALLYLILTWVFVYAFEPRSLRTWLAPLTGLIIVALIAIAAALQWGVLEFFSEHYRFTRFEIGPEGAQWGWNLRILLFAVVVLLVGGMAFLRLGKSGHGRVVIMRLMLLTLLISLAVVLLESGSGIHVEILLCFPAAVLVSKYLESVKRKNLKEGILAAILLICLLTYVGDWVVK